MTDVPAVHAFLDDIYVTGRNYQQEFERLETVLPKLQKYRLWVNKKKSEFLKQSVQYYGYIIHESSSHKKSLKIESVLKAPE